MMALIKSTLWVASNVAALGVMVTVVWFVGKVILRRIEFHSLLERWVFTTVLGFGVAGVALFLLAAVGLLYKWLLITLTGVIAVIAITFLVRRYRNRSLTAIQSWRNLAGRSPTVLIIALVGGVYWLVILISSQYPPANWDSTAYHLVLARSFLNEHRLIVEPGIPVPVTPSLNHMLFSWAMALRSDVLAQMVEHTFMMLTALGLFAWGRRRGSQPLGIAAAALWLSHPLVLWLGESAYVDMGATAFVFTGLYAICVSSEERNPSFFYIGMALVGAAAGTKLPGLFFAGLSAGFGLWLCLRSCMRVRQLALGCLIALGVLAPFYAFIFLETGNPFWPTLAEYSRGVWSDQKVIAWNNWIQSIGVPKNTLNFLTLPFRIVFSPDVFAADAHKAFSRLLLVWPVAWAVAFFNRSVRWWTIWALLFALFWFVSSQQLRFLVPAVPMMGLALFESIEWMVARIAPRKSVRLMGIVFVAVALILAAVRTRTNLRELSQRGLPPASQGWRENYLATRSGYAAVKYINARCGSNDTVYVVYGGWLNYYFNARVIDFHGLIQNGPAPSFTGTSADLWTHWLASKRVNWIYVFHLGLPAYLKPPSDDASWRPAWRGYSLVYEDSTAWVFRISDTPLSNSAALRLTRLNGNAYYTETFPREEPVEPAENRRQSVDQFELHPRELSTSQDLSIEPPARY